MSIQNEITRLSTAKKDIAAAIKNKGVSVPSDLTIDGYAAKINEIMVADVFTGATTTSDGTSGLVPAPTSADKDSYLKGDGTWSKSDAALSSSSANPVQNKIVYAALPWEYSATFYVDSWNTATSDEQAQGFAYRQVVTPVKKISVAPTITANSMFLGFGSPSDSSVLATKVALAEAANVINGGLVYTGSNSITVLVEEKPTSDVTMTWWLRT